MTDEDDMFSRWSKRKRAVAHEEARETPAPADPEPAPAAKEDVDETALLHRLNLPVPESMQPGDDFSAFMKAGVPEFLRKRALRMLWRSNPVLANLDGLNDYDDDFRSPEMTKKVLATAYKVGRGFLRADPPPEILRDNDAEKTAVSSESPESAPDPAGEETVPAPPADAAIAEVARESEDDTESSFQPRRMRFDT